MSLYPGFVFCLIQGCMYHTIGTETFCLIYRLRVPYYLNRKYLQIYIRETMVSVAIQVETFFCSAKMQCQFLDDSLMCALIVPQKMLFQVGLQDYEFLVLVVSSEYNYFANYGSVLISEWYFFLKETDMAVFFSLSCICHFVYA